MFDLVTFNIVVICLALAFSLAWFVLWRSFSHPREIGGWVVCCALMTLGSGFVLHSFIMDAFDESFWGHVLLTAGFGMLWYQACRLANRPAPWIGLAALNGVGVVALVFAMPHPKALQCVYSTFSAGPFLMSIAVLARYLPLSPAIRLSIFGLATATVGEVVRAVVVLILLVEGIPASLSNPIAIAAVLFIVFGIVMCMFGFLLGVIERERDILTALAVRDDLTGLFSRRHFQDSLERHCRLALQDGRPFCLLALDLDGFKLVNDAHGHAAGDDCLKRFGDVARARLRGADEIARIGGDEFGVILPDTLLPEAVRLAEAVREAVAEEVIRTGTTELRLTLSVGVAEWNRERCATPATLKAVADKALYRAKREGRNRTASARPAWVAEAG